MITVYQPKGKILPLLAAMQDDPYRSFTIPEAAKVMGTGPKGVMATVKYALNAGAMFRGENEEGLTVLRGRPFNGERVPSLRIKGGRLNVRPERYEPDLEDIRIPRVVPGWFPPKMVCVRGV